jgi:hypothetical protein
MSPQPKPRLDPVLVQIMRDLTRAGFQLLPLGGGPDGKAPLCRFDGVRLSLGQVMGRMGARGSHLYGVRLEGLVVLDLDADDPGLVSYLEARFGPAAVQVQTSRGRHLWYRAPDGPLPNLRREGLTVDVKSGQNAYVVGPGSMRPDGRTYVPAKGNLATGALTALNLPALADLEASAVVASPAFPTFAVREGGKVPEGRRHAALTSEAVRAARTALSLEHLMDHLRLVVLRDFATPETFPDAEIAGLASWAWRKRLENRLWGADNSTFGMSRQVRATLKDKPYAMEAWWLLSVLTEAHGHIPGKRFVLDREAMNGTGLNLSERAFLGARRLLEAEGLLRRATGHRAGLSLAQWQLARPLGNTSP